jgi:hypothetical protein
MDVSLLQLNGVTKSNLNTRIRITSYQGYIPLYLNGVCVQDVKKKRK